MIAATPAVAAIATDFIFGLFIIQAPSNISCFKIPRRICVRAIARPRAVTSL
jgi:hypothetical protein